jgi:hypothetical protein
MRRGPKIGLAVLGSAVVASVLLLSRQPTDAFAWIRKYGGKQTYHETRPFKTSTITVTTLTYKELPPELAAEAKRRYKLLNQESAPQLLFDVSDDKSFWIDRKGQKVHLTWQTDKSWFRQRWEGFLTVLGL